ncbi:SDR family oxidoreductase [uncultured Amnibacterium sp.]|uniref:SDR family oxidoreductase n=1 Tax=uncultured Amnibacterium sp. TaxID=1631851 RepID=UPI0035CAEE32
MAIVVTGASGVLGRMIVDRLIARGVSGDDILATGRDRHRLSSAGALGARTVIGTYDEPESLDPLLGSGDTLMFISSSEVGKRHQQHQNVVEAAKRAGVGRIVYTSAPHVDASTLPMAPEHWDTENMITASGIPFTILRNNWYTENEASLLPGVERTNELLTGWNEGRIASASRIDYAEGAAAVLTGDGHENAIYEFSGDTAWDGIELAQAFTAILGRTILYHHRTSDEQEVDLLAQQVPPERIQARIAIDTAIARGDLADANPTLSRLIGRPTTPLLEGLKAALEHPAAS